MLRCAALLWLAFVAFACGSSEPPAPEPPTTAPEPEVSQHRALRERANALFQTLPDEVASEENPVTDAKVELGRMLYYDTRFSKSQEISCNSCHLLDAFGVDGKPVSPGHEEQLGARNSPSVYNAALHVAQFWDGRAPNVEEQALGPVLNPVEMAMPDEASVLGVIGSIPGYLPLFEAAFPGDEDPITYANFGRAIGAFERRLLTPSRFDAWLEGQDDALDADEVAGLETFVSVGCIQCHIGPAIGGSSYQKLGRNEPYETEDLGRFEATGEEADKYFFKVPSLRNVAKTGPWLHDGSIADLDEMIRIMGRHQLGVALEPEQVRSIRAFLESLTGSIDSQTIAMPALPESGPETPGPDPT